MLQPSTSAKITSLLACLLACLLAQAAVGGSFARGEDGVGPSAAVVWQGTAVGFRRQLSTRVALTWRENPFGRAVAGLARSQRIAMFLDRRVDPNRKIDFAVQDVSLQDALRELAETQGLGVGYVGTVVYLGPPRVTERLATLLEAVTAQLVSWPAETRGQLTRRQAWNWPSLAEPRQLIEQLALGTGVEIQGIDQLPHDLWPAVELPPLTFNQRLTLVLAGFDRTFEFLPGGNRVRIVPIQGEVTLRRAYPVPRDPSVSDGKERRFTLRVVNKPAKALLNRLAVDLSLAVEITPSASEHVEEIITLQVANVTLDELLSAALQPLGLNHELSGSQLTIRLRNVDDQAHRTPDTQADDNP